MSHLVSAHASTIAGDLNNDGQVDAIDSIIALQLISLNSSSADTQLSTADINSDNKTGLAEAIYALQDSFNLCDDTTLNPTGETFDEELDDPHAIYIGSTGQSINTPWGYDKDDNTDRLYPVVVNGCYYTGSNFTDETRKEYPSFHMTYQKCSSDSEGETLAGMIDTAIEQGVRIDPNRIYLTGWSKGGSGSYKLVRGFLTGGRLFAGIIRNAGQSETVLADEAVEKTSIWYHIGTEDSDTRNQVATDAYDYVNNHELNDETVETTVIDPDNSLVGYIRTTKTLTKDSIEIMKLSSYEGMGHAADPPYLDPELFEWLFSQSLNCR